MKPTMHGFWVMLLFAVSMAALRAGFSAQLVQFSHAVGDVVASIAIVIPAWFWLQFIAQTLKSTCPRCGQRQLRFTGRFPLTREFHCDGCGYECDLTRGGHGQ